MAERPSGRVRSPAGTRAIVAGAKAKPLAARIGDGGLEATARLGGALSRAHVCAPCQLKRLTKLHNQTTQTQITRRRVIDIRRQHSDGTLGSRRAIVSSQLKKETKKGKNLHLEK